MKLTAHHNRKDALIRWNVVIRTVSAVVFLGLIATTVWYAIAIALPAHRQREEERTFESLQVQLLIVNVSEIEQFIHMPSHQ